MKLYQILWRNLLIYLLMFGGLVLAGTTGYVFLEHYSILDGVYMTIITLASVGYSETEPLHHSGKIFTIILILSNLIILTYVLTKVSRFIFDGEFRRQYKQLTMENKIEKMEGHVIICGGGQNGSEAIKELKKNNIPFVVIDKVEGNYAHERDFFILDDATKDDVLLKAGIKNAKAILITLPNDAENMFVVLTAKELNPSIRIISRASKDTSVKRLKNAGATNVIMPDKLGGVHMANLVLYPDVKEFIDVMSTYQTHGNKISELHPSRSQTLEKLDAWQKTGILILGIKKPTGEYIINPEPDYMIDLKDKIILLGNSKQLQELKKIV